MVGVADDEAALLEAPNAVVAVGEAATSVAAVALGEPRRGRRAARCDPGVAPGGWCARRVRPTSDFMGRSETGTTVLIT